MYTDIFIKNFTFVPINTSLIADSNNLVSPDYVFNSYFLYSIIIDGMYFTENLGIYDVKKLFKFYIKNPSNFSYSNSGLFIHATVSIIIKNCYFKSLYNVLYKNVGFYVLS